MLAVVLTGALDGYGTAGAQESRAEIPGAGQACLEPSAWMILEAQGPRRTTSNAALVTMAGQEVVLLGERHDDPDHHLWQLQALAGLQALRPGLVIGFEMFPRRVQPALDRWVAGELTVKQFLDQTDWHKVWNVVPEIYLPLFQFARINRIPMLALNVEDKLNRAILEKGWDGVPEREREGVGKPAPPAAAYRDFLLEIYRRHASLGGQDTAEAQSRDPAFQRFVESQITWDRAMAEALARQVKAEAAGGKRLVVGVMGGGHIRFGHGVPHQLRDLGIRKVGVLMPVAADSNCKDLPAGFADAVFALPKAIHPPAQPPRLGVRLEEEKGAVRIAEVVADSLAEKSGLKNGDQLVEIAGRPVDKTLAVVAAIRQQPAGTWLPIKLKRGEQNVELVIKFPVWP